MNQPARKPLPKAMVIVMNIFALIFFVGGILLIGMGTQTIQRELALRHGAHTVEAQVLETRVTVSRLAGKTYGVRYQFSLPGSPRIFSGSDETGREGLMMSVATEAEWLAVRKSGRISVSYLPSDPVKNRPTRAGAMPLGDPIAGLVLGAIMAFGGLIGLRQMIIAIFSLRKKLSSQ